MLVLSYETSLHNSDLRLGIEFDCNLKALLDRCARPLIDFNVFRNCIGKFHMVACQKF